MRSFTFYHLTSAFNWKCPPPNKIFRQRDLRRKKKKKKMKQLLLVNLSPIAFHWDHLKWNSICHRRQHSVRDRWSKTHFFSYLVSINKSEMLIFSGSKRKSNSLRTCRNIYFSDIKLEFILGVPGSKIIFWRLSKAKKKKVILVGFLVSYK